MHFYYQCSVRNSFLRLLYKGVRLVQIRASINYNRSVVTKVEQVGTQISVASIQVLYDEMLILVYKNVVSLFLSEIGCRKLESKEI